ncbi:MAG: hypothetical protein NC127_02545 [Muribaculum sp.]|nr:hypothetical protein [Muribaculum sp.]
MLRVTLFCIGLLALVGCANNQGIAESDATKAEAFEEEWPEDMYYYHYSAKTGEETIKGHIPEGELNRARETKEQTMGMINITLRSDSYIAKYGEPKDTVEQLELDFRDPAMLEISEDSLLKLMQDFAASHDGRL